MPLISLVYVSLATRDLTDEELRDILNTARTFNPTQNITGMLLYRDRFFIQVLEGEKDPVEALFAKIATDARHRNVLLVYEGEIQERAFGNWVMGFNKLDETVLTPEEREAFTSFLSNPDPQFFVENPNRAQRLLERFVDKTYF